LIDARCFPSARSVSPLVLSACALASRTKEDHDGTPQASPGASPMASPGASPMASPAAGGNHVVEMNDQLKFDPEDLTIKVGDTVTWVTVGAVPHTSTADPEQAVDPDFVKLPEGAETWDSGIVNTDEEFSRTFEVPGEYVYFCTPHQTAGMVASLTVKE
jgi:plastocyanin